MFTYFTKYPVIPYNGSLAINILARVKFTEAAKKAGAVFYPYSVSDGERPDIIAANYYDDPRYSWVIYLANDIIDPYHDWILTEKEFRDYIIKKYGSIDKAYREIAYWEDNWYADETTLSISAYNALSAARKKYFKPVTGVQGNVVNYVRNGLNLAVESNKTIEITVANTSSYTIGEQITQATSGTTTGSGFIKGISDNKLVAQNIIGTFANTGGSVANVIGYDSKATSAASNVATINTAIPADELSYWTYVTKYDYENQINEQKRFIQLLDKSFIDQIEKEMDELL